MGEVDDVEFVVGETDTLPGDDVVEFGRGPSARWLTGSIIAAVLILGVAVLVAHATRNPAASSPNAVIGQSAPATPSALGSPLRHAPSAAVDVAVLDGRVFALQAGRVVSLDMQNGQLAGQTLIPQAPSDAGVLRLVADPSGAHLWVVDLGVAPSTVVELDPWTMAVTRMASWPYPITSTTVLDGSLYISGTNVGVWPPDAARPRLVPQLNGLTGFAGQIVADPVRDRLLLVQARVPVALFVYQPGKTVRAVGQLPVARAQLAVVDGMIWLVGYAMTGTAVFAPMNPDSLQPGIDKDVVVDLGLGAVSAAVGQSVVWLRNGSTDALWCVDARTGRVLNNWSAAPGQVASVLGAAFVATGSAVEPLNLGGCPG